MGGAEAAAWAAEEAESPDPKANIAAPMTITRKTPTEIATSSNFFCSFCSM
jgi:hypothetical protein